MAASTNLTAYSEALVVLGTAGIVVPLVHRFGLNPVLGYLAAGTLLGPLGLGSLVEKAPWLRWFTVTDPKNVAGIADLGVVFLLFLIGLELTYERLVAMRRLVFGLGGSQVVVTTCLLAGIAALFGLSAPVAILVGACLALSSTAIVLDVLSRQGRLVTTAGRSSFAVLLAQDLAVIPILMYVSVLALDQGASIGATLGTALVQALAAVALIVLVGRAMLRPLFRLVARTESSELFIAAILFVIVATGVIAAAANLSMALGAFVAGLLLGETEYRKAIEATIEPFKGLLLGLFFFTVGMTIDGRELIRAPLLLTGAVLGLMALKAAVLYALARWYRIGKAPAAEMALLLGPGGEFAFVGIGLAAQLGIVDKSVAGFTLAATSLSMVLIPVMAALAHRVTAKLEPPRPADPALALVPRPQQRHAIVIGHGRVGKTVCDLLERHKVPYTAADLNALTVAEDRASGHAVYYGDATNPAFLRACGILDASALIITIRDQLRIDAIVHEARLLRPDIPIVVRARDADHARRLYASGVTDAVPETIEASLQLSEAALAALGLPAGPVIASIHEKRDEFRHALQEAAAAAGLEETRSIRPKGRQA